MNHKRKTVSSASKRSWNSHICGLSQKWTQHKFGEACSLSNCLCRNPVSESQISVKTHLLQRTNVRRLFCCTWGRTFWPIVAMRPLWLLYCWACKPLSVLGPVHFLRNTTQFPCLFLKVKCRYQDETMAPVQIQVWHGLLTWDNSWRLVVDSNFKSCWRPLHKLNRFLGLDGLYCTVYILQTTNSSLPGIVLSPRGNDRLAHRVAWFPWLEELFQDLLRSCSVQGGAIVGAPRAKLRICGSLDLCLRLFTTPNCQRILIGEHILDLSFFRAEKTGFFFLYMFLCLGQQCGHWTARLLDDTSWTSLWHHIWECKTFVLFILKIFGQHRLVVLTLGTTSPRYNMQQAMYLPCRGSHFTSWLFGSKQAVVISPTVNCSWYAFWTAMIFWNEQSLLFWLWSGTLINLMTPPIRVEFRLNYIFLTRDFARMLFGDVAEFSNASNFHLFWAIPLKSCHSPCQFNSNVYLNSGFCDIEKEWLRRTDKIFPTKKTFLAWQLFPLTWNDGCVCD